jgi:hypothetical protein
MSVCVIAFFLSRGARYLRFSQQKTTRQPFILLRVLRVRGLRLGAMSTGGVDDGNQQIGLAACRLAVAASLRKRYGKCTD